MATATIIQATNVIPYTPSGAKSKGDIVVTVSRVGVVMRDIAASVAGELCVGGLASFPKSTAGSSAIADGTQVFWKAGSGVISTTSTDGNFLGTTVGASVDADATQSVQFSSATAEASLAQATVVAALTDNSGGATADGTIGVVTAPTALTDSGGGTADNTVAAMTAATALTVTDGAGTNDGTIDAITNNATTIAAVQEIAAKIATLATFSSTVKDNFKELTTAQAANRVAIVALTDAVKEITTEIASILTSLKTAGLMASS